MPLIITSGYYCPALLGCKGLYFYKTKTEVYGSAAQTLITDLLEYIYHLFYDINPVVEGINNPSPSLIPILITDLLFIFNLWAGLL